MLNVLCRTTVLFCAMYELPALELLFELFLPITLLPGRGLLLF